MLRFVGFCAVCALFILSCTDGHPNEVRSASLAPMIPQKVLPVAPPLDPALDSFIRQYHQYFSQAMIQGSTPGSAVVIVKDSQIVWMRGYGVKVAGTRDSVDANTVFRVGSLSKGFTGVLSGILVQEGAFKWTDKIQQYYPSFSLKDKNQAKRVQVRHVLSHTTGLPYHAYTNLIEEGHSIPEIATYFPKTGVYGKEGEYYSYQNAAFCMIEEVMLKATQNTFPNLIREKLFTPNHMQTASADYAAIQANGNKAYPHFQTGWSWRADSISPLYYNSAAAGGINASISDMGEWLKLLLGWRDNVVADTTLDRVFTPIVKTDKERRIFPGWIARDAASYALGWRILTYDDQTIVYHGGYVNGFRGEIALNRKEGIAICVLFNAFTDATRDCIPVFFEQWDTWKHKIL